jgi:hypothetical protein
MSRKGEPRAHVISNTRKDGSGGLLCFDTAYPIPSTCSAVCISLRLNHLHFNLALLSHQSSTTHSLDGSLLGPHRNGFTLSIQPYSHLHRALLDQIRRLFPNSVPEPSALVQPRGGLFVRWHLGVTTMQSRHHATVRDPKPFDSTDLEFLVQNSHLIVSLSHLTSPGSMVACCRVLFDVWNPFFSTSESMMRQV